MLHITVLREASFESPAGAQRFATALRGLYFPSYVTVRLREPDPSSSFVFTIEDSEGRKALKSLRSLALLQLAAADELTTAWTGPDFHVSYY